MSSRGNATRNESNRSRTEVMNRRRGKGHADADEEEEDADDDLGLVKEFKLKRKGLMLLLPSLVQKRSAGVGGGGGSTTHHCTTTTPVLAWKAGDGTEKKGGFIGGIVNESGGGGRHTIIDEPPTTSSSLSFSLRRQPSLLSPSIPVRKLGVGVWEFFQYFSSPVEKSMQFVGGGGGDPSHGRMRYPNQRRVVHHQQHRHERGDDDDEAGGDASLVERHPATAADSLRHQVTSMIAKHRRAAERNHIQPLSPATCGSSMEITRYEDPGGITPSTSIELKPAARIHNTTPGFKTSSELLKVLNRIWSLEEQHAANTSLVRSLETELHHAHARIKSLMREQKTRRHEMDALMNHREQQEAIDAVRREVEEERKLRMRSEGMHRRLSREMFEVKVALSASVKEAERERRRRCVLEELCDEFAGGVKMKLRHDSKSGDAVVVGDDGLVRRMCELWLDERVRMKESDVRGGEAQGVGNVTVVDRLSREIQSFLRTRKQVGGGDGSTLHNEIIHHHNRRNSLESFPLNEGGSAPRFNEDSSAGCFETKQMENGKTAGSSSSSPKKPVSSRRAKGQTTTSSDDIPLKLDEEAPAEYFTTSKTKQNEIQPDLEPPPVEARKSTSTRSPLRSGKAAGVGEIGKGQQGTGGDIRSSSWTNKSPLRSSPVSTKPISELLKSDAGGGRGGGGGILSRYRMIMGSPDLGLGGRSSSNGGRRGQRSRLKILRGFT